MRPVMSPDLKLSHAARKINVLFVFLNLYQKKAHFFFY